MATAKYDTVIATEAMLNAIWPDWGSRRRRLDINVIFQNAHDDCRREILKQCRARHQHTDQIVDSDVFGRLESYMTLAQLCEANMTPQNPEGTQAAAKLWRSRWAEELQRVEYQIDDAVTNPDAAVTTEREEGIGNRWELA